MDFIMQKIENRLALSDPGTYDYITDLRKCIEYSLYLCLGYSWKNLDNITQEKRNYILSNLNNMSIGTVISAIRELDFKCNEIIVTKKGSISLNNYPNIRNEKIGHGYSMSNSIASAFLPLYEELKDAIPLLKEKCDIIIVKTYDRERNIYLGIRYPENKNGMGEKWTCPSELIAQSNASYPRTYIFYRNEYYKVSPFVFVEPDSLSPFVFSSLTEKIIGKTKLISLFPNSSKDSVIENIFQEIICISKEDGERQYSQSNGTIMNKLIPNYSKYVDVGLKKIINNFLVSNRAYVTATVWGHGGVGKTACIQNICYDLFNDTKKRFSYIVFITAKDRVYNVRTGEIDSQHGNVRLFSEVIEKIVKTIFDVTVDLQNSHELLEEYEKKIREFQDTLLIVIDDYETFDDNEKSYISNFLSSLDARYHKVIITTRNNRFVIGEPIPSNELNIGLTKIFIDEVIKNEYSEHANDIEKVVSVPEKLNSIFIATSGRPIFIYQFIHLFVQRGYQKELIEGISKSENAQEFLYGRIVQYLSKYAQYLFATSSVIVDDDLQFNLEVLEYILSKVMDKNYFDNSLAELESQKIIEQTSTVFGRVYSSELLMLMCKQYNEYPQEYKDTVRNLLNNIGGKVLKGSILEAMLTQADKSRAFSNEQETVEKYRRVLNDKKSSYKLKKIALKHVADYLSNTRLNPLTAIALMEEYISDFKDDVDIYVYYIYLLWSQSPYEKEKAVNRILEFFSLAEHKKTSQEYLTFFALCTGYCIDFDIQFRKYSSLKLRNARYLKTFNEYGKELFSYLEKNNTLKGKPALFHNIRVALVQTIKLCYEISKYEKRKEKALYAMKICAWMRKSNLKEPFKSQINRWEKQFQVLENGNTNFNNSKLIEVPLPQLTTDFETEEKIANSIWTENGEFHVGDIVNVKIKNIVSYGAFASIDNATVGLIHISEIANHFIKDINLEFSLGQECFARIMTINGPRIELSTKALNED